LRKERLLRDDRDAPVGFDPAGRSRGAELNTFEQRSLAGVLCARRFADDSVSCRTSEDHGQCGRIMRSGIPRKPRRRKNKSALRAQYATLPYRFTTSAALEILLVTSRRSKRWIIPKGWSIMSSADGLGHAIFKAGSLYILSKVFAELVVRNVFGAGTIYAVSRVERMLLPWRHDLQS
jgi:hypothetical protein